MPQVSGVGSGTTVVRGCCEDFQYAVEGAGRRGYCEPDFSVCSASKGRLQIWGCDNNLEAPMKFCPYCGEAVEIDGSRPSSS